MKEASSLTDYLWSFNRKERFFLIGWSLGNPRFRASRTFLRSISSLLGIDIPPSAFVAMDYHLDWLYASVFLSSGKTGDQDVHSNTRRLITGTQEDIDLLIAYRKGRTNHVVMVEAKGATGWTNKQALSKARRLTKIFGRDGGRWPSIRPHYVLASPRPPQQLNLSAWPSWMKRPDASPYWVEMPMPPDLMRTTRCDKDGERASEGTYWTVAAGLN